MCYNDIFVLFTIPHTAGSDLLKLWHCSAHLFVEPPPNDTGASSTTSIDPRHQHPGPQNFMFRIRFISNARRHMARASGAITGRRCRSNNKQLRSSVLQIPAPHCNTVTQTFPVLARYQYQACIRLRQPYVSLAPRAIWLHNSLAQLRQAVA
jgi:hypothetical protein